MSDSTIYEKLNNIFRNIFDDERIDVNESLSALDIDDWDSLANISIVVAVEKDFGVKFSMSDVVEFKCVGDMVRKIKLQLEKRGDEN